MKFNWRLRVYSEFEPEPFRVSKLSFGPFSISFTMWQWRIILKPWYWGKDWGSPNAWCVQFGPTSFEYNPDPPYRCESEGVKNE